MFDHRARRVFAATTLGVAAGIVYDVAIRAALELDGWALGADHLLHTVVPVLAVYGWVRYGPRGRTAPAVARPTVLLPLTWFVFTLVRGWSVDGYPYTFVNVTKLGNGTNPAPVAP